jgi:hypothetical protein
MPTTDTGEKGLETLIVESLVHEAGYQLGHRRRNSTSLLVLL